MVGFPTPDTKQAARKRAFPTDFPVSLGVDRLMEVIVLILFSVGPAILWVWFFKRHDRLEPEPSGLLAKAFITGIIAVIPAGLIEMPLIKLWGQNPNPWSQLLFLILGVGLVEETAKLLAVYFSVYNSQEFAGALDGIIYMATAGFGFAAAENFLYTYSFGWEIGPVRAVVTSLAHASFSGVVGFNLGLVHGGDVSYLAVVSSLMSVSVLHGVYNFILFSRIISPLLALLLIILLYRYLASRIREAQTRF